jgi:hypothetical protein
MASAAVAELAPPLKRGASATAAASPVRAVPVTKLMSLALSQSCRSPTGVMANCLAMGTGAAARIDVTIVMPCLNEAKWLPAYIANAREALTRIRAELGLTGEVLIADNGSADGSQLIARALGATLVEVRNQVMARRSPAACSRRRARYWSWATPMALTIFANASK